LRTARSSFGTTCSAHAISGGELAAAIAVTFNGFVGECHALRAEDEARYIRLIVAADLTAFAVEQPACNRAKDRFRDNLGRIGRQLSAAELLRAAWRLKCQTAAGPCAYPSWSRG